MGCGFNPDPTCIHKPVQNHRTVTGIFMQYLKCFHHMRCQWPTTDYTRHRTLVDNIASIIAALVVVFAKEQDGRRANRDPLVPDKIPMTTCR